MSKDKILTDRQPLRTATRAQNIPISIHGILHDFLNGVMNAICYKVVTKWVRLAFVGVSDNIIDCYNLCGIIRKSYLNFIAYSETSEIDSRRLGAMRNNLNNCTVLAPVRYPAFVWYTDIRVYIFRVWNEVESLLIQYQGIWYFNNRLRGQAFGCSKDKSKGYQDVFHILIIRENKELVAWV